MLPSFALAFVPSPVGPQVLPRHALDILDPFELSSKSLRISRCCSLGVEFEVAKASPGGLKAGMVLGRP